MTASAATRPDVLVVGAGVIGLSSAWAAARRGLDVVVCERDRPGAGASTVAAGMLAPVGEAHFGELAQVALTTASHAQWPDFAAAVEEDSGLSVGLRRDGALHAALDRDEADELRRLYDFHREQGLDSEWLAPSACRELEPGLSPACAGGLWAPHEASVDTVALIAALRHAAERNGARIRSATEVVGMLGDHRRIRGVRLADGSSIEADQVVLASGAWAGQADWLPPDARPPVRPVKGEILSLRGSADDPVCRRIVCSPRVYCVPRADGRLVVGATVLERDFDDTVSAGGVHELLREAYRALPEVSELQFVEARAGLRPASPDNAPLVGPGTIEGLVLATGHFRNGVLLAPITADGVVAALTGKTMPAPWAALAPDRFAGHPA